MFSAANDIFSTVSKTFALRPERKEADDPFVSTFKNRNSQELIVSTTVAIQKIGTGGGAPYFTPAETISVLEDLSSSLKVVQEGQESLRLALKAAVESKAAQMADVEAALTALQAKLAADPRVSDSALTAAGFSRRASGRSEPKAPSVPTDVAASPTNEGTAKVRWKRGAITPNSTSFLVERSEDGVNFSIVDSTRCASYTVPDVAPGVPCYFRVTATTRAGRSAPSQVTGVYLPGLAARPSLKLAA